MNTLVDLRIDVVTVCRNAASLIGSTIKSVANQTRQPHRYIVIDGASTDQTQDVIAQYSEHITHFLSEPDSGISEAMNKALHFSDGDYVLFLHAGDRLASEYVLADVARALKQLQPDILACPVILDISGGELLAKPRGFGLWMRMKTGVLHQGALCARRLFDVVGPFDESLKVAMDYEFFLRAYLAGASLNRYPVPLAHMVSGGISWRRDWPTLKARLGEERRIHGRYAHSRLAHGVYSVYWLLYPAYKRMATYFGRGS